MRRYLLSTRCFTFTALMTGGGPSLTPTSTLYSTTNTQQRLSSSSSLTTSLAPSSSLSLTSVAGETRSKRNRFLKQVDRMERVAYPIPPLMDSDDFVRFVRRRTQVMKEWLIAEDLESAEGTGTSRSVAEVAIRNRWDQQLIGLTEELRGKDVETYVWEGPHALKSDHMGGCLVPYRLATNFLLSRFPQDLRARAIEQLKCEEQVMGGYSTVTARKDAPRELTLRTFQMTNNCVDEGATGQQRSKAFRIIEWTEVDVYGNKSSMTTGEPRVPVFVVLGHTSHGKTTLVDKLHGGPQELSNVEESNSTQTLRAFTVPMTNVGNANELLMLRELQAEGDARLTAKYNANHKLEAPENDVTTSEKTIRRSKRRGAMSAVVQESSNVASDSPATPNTGKEGASKRSLYPEWCTVIDTPGHRIFAEMRLYTIVASDYVLLVVSLVDGVKAQTREAIKVALNVDRPVFVIFTKIDAFTDEGSASGALATVVGDLRECGLFVTLCGSEQDVANICRVHNTSKHANNNNNGRERWREYFLKQKDVDPLFEGSIESPQLKLFRKCIGICISAKRGINMDVLASLMKWAAIRNTPVAQHTKYTMHAAPCAVQAMVLESSKQAYDAEASQSNGGHSRNAMEHQLDQRREKRIHRYEKQNSLKGRMMQAQRYFLDGRGAHSNAQANPNVFITVLVKSGVLCRGVPFVADQMSGVVEHMMDYWGNPLDTAVPGMVVTVVDRHSKTGVPGACIHLLSMPTLDAACDVFEYRRILQWYIEVFPKKLELLRPRGMETQFRHLGNYGQSPQMNATLGFQLLYGAPRLPEKEALAIESSQQEDLKPVSLGKDTEMMANSSQQQALEMSKEAFLKAQSSIGQYFMQQNMEAEHDEAVNHVVSATDVMFRSLQLPKPLETMEEYTAWAQSAFQVGVLLKIDTWHSARIMHREISKFGTRKVSFSVITVRFGRMTPDDYLVVSGSAKVVLCYRTPPANSVVLEKLMDVHKVKFCETSVFAEAAAFLRKAALEIHIEKFGREGLDDDVREAYFDAVSEVAGVRRERDKRLMRKQRLACTTNQ